MIVGKSTRYGIVSSFTQILISGTFSSTRNRFPTHIETISPQKSAGSSVRTFGPGVMPWMMNAPSMSAITDERGDAELQSLGARGEEAEGDERFGDRAVDGRVLLRDDDVVGHRAESKPACSAATAAPTRRSTESSSP
jgi:hypothetical protein